MPRSEADKMSLGEHIDDLRKRLIRCVIALTVTMIICFVMGDYLFKVMFYPLAVATNGHPPHLYVRALPEGFTTYFRVCLLAGLFLASPYLLYQLWQFIAAGLYEHERKAVSHFFLPSVGLFCLGVVFFYIVVSPLVVHYFLSFSSSSFPSAPQVPEWAGDLVRHTGGKIETATAPSGGSLVQPWLELGQYISFTASLSLVFGLAFQMPLVVIFLVRMGLVDPKMLRKLRKHIFFAIVVIAAIISPSPDVMTMLAMALPMYALYEIGLLIGVRALKRKASAA